MDSLTPLDAFGECRNNADCFKPRGKHFSKKYIALLHALCHADKNQRAALIRTADKNLIKCICECVLNVLHGVVELKKSEKDRLKKHKKVLRKLVGNKTTLSDGAWRSRKRTLVQSGGSFLPFLLIPLLGALFSKIIGS